MKPEGMVHALNEIHRLLKPGGVLIDIHPNTEHLLIEVHQGGKILYSKTKPKVCFADYVNADTALAQVVNERKFILERNERFEFFIYASSVAEYCEYQRQDDAFDESSVDASKLAEETELFAPAETIMNQAGEGAEVIVRENVLIARLTPIKGI